MQGPPQKRQKASTACAGRRKASRPKPCKPGKTARRPTQSQACCTRFARTGPSLCPLHSGAWGQLRGLGPEGLHAVANPNSAFGRDTRSYKTQCLTMKELVCEHSKRKKINRTPIAWLNSTCHPTNSFVIGTAVINTHTHTTGFSTSEAFNKTKVQHDDLPQLSLPGTGYSSLEGASRMVEGASRMEPRRAHTSTSSLPCSGCSPRRDTELNENTCHTAVD